MVEPGGIRNITHLLKEKKEMLRKVEDAAMAGRSMNWIKRLKREINNLLSKEEKKKVKTTIESAVVV